eukprot:scaffold105723_cov28-Tisochrysis_lutea.AAC.2
MSLTDKRQHITPAPNNEAIINASPILPVGNDQLGSLKHVQPAIQVRRRRQEYHVNPCNCNERSALDACAQHPEGGEAAA